MYLQFFNSKEKLAKINAAIVSFLIVAVFLEIVPRLFFHESKFIFPLSEVLYNIEKAFEQGLIINMAMTVLRTLVGFLISCFLGITFGILIGRSEKIYNFLNPLIDFFRPLPSSAIIPIAMVVLGLGEISYLFIIVFGATWPVLINTIDGVKYIDQTAKSAIVQYSLSKTFLLKKFIFPEAAPEIYTGMKLSLSISLILSVTAELVIRANLGLGRFLMNMYDGPDFITMHVTILFVAVLGFIMNTLLGLLEKKHRWLNYKH
jgi:ABC-type nitrate/sulfonate/bicarbonate transport system permease component